MSDEKQRTGEAEAVEDLELTDRDADRVRGGDGLPISNTVKQQQDMQKGIAGNLKP